MSDDDKANGHPAIGLLHLLHPALKTAELITPEDLPFDIEALYSALVRVQAEVPPETYSAPLLGTQREGTGIVIDGDGLILTIGYAILEATSVTLTTASGRTVQAHVAGYDYETGFGLVRALEALDIAPMPLGRSADCNERDPVIISAYGGRRATVSGLMVSRREFAGYWEYLLDEALFTAPPHPAWSGAALVGTEGRLLGVGSLYVADALPGAEPLPGNMFVPIDLLDPILADMLRMRRVDRPPRPWLGMFTSEGPGLLVVAGVIPNGPADRAGIQAGDMVMGVTGERIEGLAAMYRRIWGLGPAGVNVPLTLEREGDTFDVTIRSADRYEFLKMPLVH